jgi:hypothetical protein
VGPEGECCVPASDYAVLLRAVTFDLSQHHLNENIQPAHYSLDMAMRLVKPQNCSYQCGKVDTVSFFHEWIHDSTLSSP